MLRPESICSYLDDPAGKSLEGTVDEVAAEMVKCGLELDDGAALRKRSICAITMSYTLDCGIVLCGKSASWRVLPL
jgi:hypothetical protein